MLMIKNNETLLLLLCISYTSVKKVRLLKGEILSLPRLSGQMANTMMSVGNEQRRSKGKFVLQRKGIVESTVHFKTINVIAAIPLISLALFVCFLLLLLFCHNSLAYLKP